MTTLWKFRPRLLKCGGQSGIAPALAAAALTPTSRLAALQDAVLAALHNGRVDDATWEGLHAALVASRREGAEG